MSALFESLNGTGKTLCLLCATLGWLMVGVLSVNIQWHSLDILRRLSVVVSQLRRFQMAESWLVAGLWQSGLIRRPQPPASWSRRIWILTLPTTDRRCIHSAKAFDLMARASNASLSRFNCSSDVLPVTILLWDTISIALNSAVAFLISIPEQVSPVLNWM